MLVDHLAIYSIPIW